MRRPTMLVLFMLVMVVAPAVVAEEDNPSYIGGLSFVDEVEVTVVNVDVFVRDKKGEPVRGLAVEDFHLTQDGIEMPISNFAELDQEIFQTVFAIPEMQVDRETSINEIEEFRRKIEPIYMVLYIDNENLHPMERNRVLRRVREFVTENLREPVQMMVISYQRSMRVLQPFTDDPVAVNAALRSVQTYTGARIDRESEMRGILERMRDEEARDYGSQRPSTTSASKDRMYQEVIGFAREDAYNLTETLTALRQVVEMLAGMHGRKSLIYVSNGLPMVPGLGLMHEYATQFHDNSIMAHRSQFDRTTAYRSLTSAANAQDVTIYALDAEGLEVRVGGDAEARYSSDPTASSIGSSNLQGSLNYMANRTGGLSITNTNDVGPGLAKIRNDLFVYYSVGYTVSRVGGDKVHRIEVELPEHSDYELRYRQRFVEKSLETKVQDTVMSSLVFDIDDNPMQLDMRVGSPSPASGDRWLVPVEISFPLRKVALIPQGEDLVGQVVLFVGARDEEGKESDVQRQEHEIRVPAAIYEATDADRMRIEFQMLMGEGANRVAVGLLDPITRQTSYQKISVQNR